MKRIILTLFAIALIAPAGHAASPVDDIAKFLKSQSFGAGIAIQLDASEPKTETIVYWRGPQFGEEGLSPYPKNLKNKDAKVYVEFNFGGRWKKGEHAKAFPMALLHPANIVEPLSKRLPWANRWKLPAFPKQSRGGLAIRIPLPGDPEPWILRDPKTWLKLVAAWEF